MDTKSPETNTKKAGRTGQEEPWECGSTGHEGRKLLGRDLELLGELLEEALYWP